MTTMKLSIAAQRVLSEWVPDEAFTRPCGRLLDGFAMNDDDVEEQRRLGRADGERLADALTREFLLDPDFDVATFELARVEALVTYLRSMLESGKSLDAVEAYGDACSETFAKSLREKILTARAASALPLKS